MTTLPTLTERAVLTLPQRAPWQANSRNGSRSPLKVHENQQKITRKQRKIAKMTDSAELRKCSKMINTINCEQTGHTWQLVY